MKSIMFFLFGILGGALFVTGLTLRLFFGNWGLAGDYGFLTCFIAGTVIIVVGLILAAADAAGELV